MPVEPEVTVKKGPGHGGVRVVVDRRPQILLRAREHLGGLRWIGLQVEEVPPVAQRAAQLQRLRIVRFDR